MAERVVDLLEPVEIDEDHGAIPIRPVLQGTAEAGVALPGALAGARALRDDGEIIAPSAFCRWPSGAG